MTNRPWSLAECVEHYSQSGIPALSVWQNVINPDEGGIGLDQAARLLGSSGLQVASLVRVVSSVLVDVGQTGTKMGGWSCPAEKSMIDKSTCCDRSATNLHFAENFPS